MAVVVSRLAGDELSFVRSVASPLRRGAHPFISRSRLVGCGVTGWRCDAVDPLCAAVDYDTPPLTF